MGLALGSPAAPEAGQLAWKQPAPAQQCKSSRCGTDKALQALWECFRKDWDVPDHTVVPTPLQEAQETSLRDSRSQHTLACWRHWAGAGRARGSLAPGREVAAQARHNEWEAGWGNSQGGEGMHPLAAFPQHPPPLGLNPAFYPPQCQLQGSWHMGATQSKPLREPLKGAEEKAHW